MPKKQTPDEMDDFQADVELDEDAVSVSELILDVDDIESAQDPEPLRPGKYKFEITRARAQIIMGSDKRYPKLQRFVISMKAIEGKLIDEDVFYKRVPAWISLPNRGYRHPVDGTPIDTDDYKRMGSEVRKFYTALGMSKTEFANEAMKCKYTPEGTDAPFLVGKTCWATVRVAQATEEYGASNRVMKWIS